MAQLLFLLFPSYKWRNWGWARLDSTLTCVLLRCETEFNWVYFREGLLNYCMKDRVKSYPGRKSETWGTVQICEYWQKATTYVFGGNGRSGERPCAQPQFLLLTLFCYKAEDILAGFFLQESDFLIWFSIEEWDKHFRETILCRGSIRSLAHFRR